MGDLCNITLESGNLTGTDDSFDATVADGGDLSVHSDAALAGTDYGLKLVIDDTKSSVWAEKNISLSTNELRWRVFLDPHSLTMDPNDKFDWFQVRFGAYPNTGAYIQLAPSFRIVSILVPLIVVLVVSVILIVFRWKVNGARVAPVEWVLVLLGIYTVVYVIYTIVFRLKVAAFGAEDDGTVVDTGWVHITGAERCFEFHLERASSEGAEDGRLRMWIDGRLKGTASNLDNYDLWSNIAALRMGAVGGVDVRTSGTLYLDELEANDDGSVIGCPVMTIGGRIRQFLGGLWRLFFWIPSQRWRKRRWFDAR
jgi:hypothetical protein